MSNGTENTKIAKVAEWWENKEEITRLSKSLVSNATDLTLLKKSTLTHFFFLVLWKV